MKSKESKGNKRKSNFLQVAPANYLIVCEGKKQNLTILMD